MRVGEFHQYAVAGVQMIVGRPKGTTGAAVQSVLFDKKAWNPKRATAWLKANDFTAGKHVESTNCLRFMQRDPGDFEAGALRTIAPGKQSSRVALDELVSAYAAATTGVSLRIGRRYDYMNTIMAAAPVDPNSAEPWEPPDPEVDDDYSLQAVIFERARFSLVEALKWMQEILLYTPPPSMRWEEDSNSFTFEMTDTTLFDPSTLRLVDAKSYEQADFVAEFAGAVPDAFKAAKKHLPTAVPGLLHHPSKSAPDMHTFSAKGQGKVRGFMHVYNDGGLKARVTGVEGDKAHCFNCKSGYKTLSQLTNHASKFAKRVGKIKEGAKSPALGDNWTVTNGNDMPDMSSMSEVEEEWKAYEQLFQIPNVDIFRSGKWNGDDYSEADLDAMVEAFPSVGFQVPLKLGHESSPGERAYGWVQSIRRVGDKLMADFKDVPASIYQIIKDRGFDQVSAEIFWNLKRGGQTFRRVLKAVALLGSETPGVSGLAPLREAVHGMPDSGFEALRTFTYKSEELQMDKIAKLTADLAEANKKIGELTKQIGTTGGDATKLAKLSEDLTAATVTVTKLTTDLEAARKELPAADVIKTMSDKLAAAEGAITSLTAANAALAERERKQLVERATAGIRIPALRGLFSHLYDLASQEGDKPRVVTFKEKQGDKEVEVKKTSIELLDDLAKAINTKAEGVFAIHSHDDRPARSEGVDDFVGDPSNEADRRAKAYMSEKGEKSYSKAVTHILKADPVLAKAYQGMTNRGGVVQ